MKKFLIIVLAICSVCAFGQQEESIKKQAEIAADALLKDDYETLIKHTHPKVVELIGGHDKMITIVKSGKQEMSKQGFTFDEVTIGTPTLTVKAGEEIHCLVPQTIMLKAPNGLIKAESHLLAVSNDGGKHWYFIDTANLTMDNIREVLPNYNMDLKLPEKKQPQFIEN